MHKPSIRLEPPKMTHCESVLEALIESENELSRFLPWVPFSLSYHETQIDMEQAIENYKKFEDELRYMITCQETGQLLGVIGLLLHNREVPYYGVEFWLRSSQTGKGIMHQALAALEAKAFGEFGANRLEISMAESNLAAQNVAKRAGYRREASLANCIRLPNGALEPLIIYSKLRQFTHS